MDDDFWYGVIKEYYGLGLYTADDLEPFIKIGWITSEQKTEIVANKVA
jgi:uncharacterized XkdX family phage protein